MELLPSVAQLQLRPVSEADVPLLYEIYVSTRQPEMDLVTHWTPAQKEQFLQGQFAAQQQHYRTNYPGACFWIINYQGQPAGRLYLHDHDTLRIMEITLLPAYRNQGLGSALLRDALALARRLGKKASIHVEQFNPALALYQRLGFEVVREVNSVYLYLECQP